jgi:outer membrane protein OmpA-like peptidoglycan-associated protein
MAFRGRLPFLIRRHKYQFKLIEKITKLFFFAKKILVLKKFIYLRSQYIEKLMNMNNKLRISAALLLLSVCSTYAQSRYSGRGDRSVNTREDFYAGNEDVSYERSALRTTWLAGSPGDNWFLSVYGGAALLGSENFRDMYFSDNLSFNGGFTLGKWFSPVWGLGIHSTMSRAKSIGFKTQVWYAGENYTTISTPVAYFDGNTKATYLTSFFEGGEEYKTKRGSTAWLYKFTYATTGVDFLLNARNLFLPYNPDAFFNPVVYGGLGYYHTFREGNRTAVNGILERFGLQLNFRLSDYIDANLSIEDMLVPEVFDRQVGGNLSQDHVMSANIGLTFYFGGRNFSPASIGVAKATAGRLQTIDDDCRDILQCEINALRTKDNRRRYNDPVPIRPSSSIHIYEEELPEDDEEIPIGRLKETAIKQIDETPRDADTPFDLTPVFFESGSHVVRTSQMISIAKAAVYLDINPGLRLEIAAFADRKTGDPHTNLLLSERRANAVADIIVNKFGVKKNRLHTAFYGDVIQPFPNNDQNRVVLFVKD